MTIVRILLLAALPLSISANELYMYKGTDIAELCEINSDACEFVLNAMLDTHEAAFAHLGVRNNTICITEETTSKKISESVITHFKDSDTDLQKPAAILFIEALHTTYSCPNT